jgi:hypothetical protein
MKVLDLQCMQGHTFEGWFASEEDFLAQCAGSLVQCPLCGDTAVHKKPSAPRLNLSTTRDHRPAQGPVDAVHATVPDKGSALTAAWLELSRRMVANTRDVGEHFAEEARKMHYGESQEQAIRGQTTVDEARALLDEGIDILPLVLPHAVKEPLQ